MVNDVVSMSKDVSQADYSIDVMYSIRMFRMISPEPGQSFANNLQLAFNRQLLPTVIAKDLEILIAAEGLDLLYCSQDVLIEFWTIMPHR